MQHQFNNIALAYKKTLNFNERTNADFRHFFYKQEQYYWTDAAFKLKSISSFVGGTKLTYRVQAKESK